MKKRKKGLTEFQKIRLIQRSVDKNTAYILWLFFGLLGWHRQYLNHAFLGYLQVALTGILAIGLWYSNLFLIMLGCFAFVQWLLDFFILDIAVDSYNDDVWFQFISEIEHERLMDMQVDFENVNNIE